MHDGKGIKSSFNLAQLSRLRVAFHTLPSISFNFISRQWKSTLRQLSFDPVFGLYASQGSLLFSDYSFPEGNFGSLDEGLYPPRREF